jgi:starch-binding outer membrane protein, SusD/RagB family
MKKLFKLLSVIVLLGSLLISYSCSEEFLTKEPPGSASATQMTTPAGVEALVLSVYERMQNGDQMFGGAMVSDWTYAGGCSDDAYKGTSAGDQSNFNLIERYEALPNNPYMEERWRNCYDGVARANVALEFLWATQALTTGEKFPEARAKTVEAELKFLRAWFHMQANKVFEKIPYVKTPTELGEIAPKDVPNTDAGWDQIEADLQFAIDNFPADGAKFRNEVGRVNIYVAKAYKAQAHMYQKEYSLAKPLLDDIINSAKFSLVSEWNWNFDMTHENNAESIFELQCSTTATAYSSVHGSGCNFHQSGAASNGGWGFYQPSRNLFDAFQTTAEGLPVLDPAQRVHLATDMGLGSSAAFTPTDHTLDPRVDFIVARRGVDFLGWGIHPGNDWIREQANGGPMMTKIFMHKKEEQSLNLNGNGFRNGKNYRMMRYASILLWRAECALAETSPDLAMARNLVNQIRNRAKGSTPVMGRCTSTVIGSTPTVDWTQPAANYKIEPYPATGFPFDTKENALKAVQHETRIEFACQNHRLWDLRRWGIMAQTLNAFIADDVSFRGFMIGATFDAERDDYYPIPQSQMDLQPGVLTQDPAY